MTDKKKTLDVEVQKKAGAKGGKKSHGGGRPKGSKDVH